MTYDELNQLYPGFQNNAAMRSKLSQAYPDVFSNLNPTQMSDYQTQSTQQAPLRNDFQAPMLTALNNSQSGSLGQTFKNYDPMSTSAFSPIPQTSAQTNVPSYAGANYSDILSPIQNEIGRIQKQGQQSLSDYMAQRQGYQGQLQSDLMNEMQAGLTASTPGIENRLQQLGIAQSGSYPALLEQQKANILSSSILPQLSQFDTNTFNQASQIPLNTLQQMQGLQSGSLGRQFGLQDIASQQAFQSSLADKMAQQQQLQSVLGLLPSLMGNQGLPGLLGAMGGGGSMGGGSASGGGGSGGSSGGILAGNAGSGMGPGDPMSLLGSLISGGGGGALGSYLGGQLGGGTGAGMGGALGGLLSGGGLGSALGGGIGGAFGGPLGGAIGGGLGSVANQYIPDLADYLSGSSSGILDSIGNFMQQDLGYV